MPYECGAECGRRIAARRRIGRVPGLRGRGGSHDASLISLPDPEAGALLGARSLHDLAVELERLADDGLEIGDTEHAEEPTVVAAACHYGRIGTFLEVEVDIRLALDVPL